MTSGMNYDFSIRAIDDSYNTSNISFYTRTDNTYVLNINSENPIMIGYNKLLKDTPGWYYIYMTQTETTSPNFYIGVNEFYFVSQPFYNDFDSTVSFTISKQLTTITMYDYNNIPITVTPTLTSNFNFKYTVSISNEIQTNPGMYYIKVNDVLSSSFLINYSKFTSIPQYSTPNITWNFTTSNITYVIINTSDNQYFTTNIIPEYNNGIYTVDLTGILINQNVLINTPGDYYIECQYNDNGNIGNAYSDIFTI